MGCGEFRPLHRKGVSMKHSMLIVVASFVVTQYHPVFAGGIIPDRNNQLLIRGQFDSPTPEFIVVFSAQPLTLSNGKIADSFLSEDFAKLKTTVDQVILKLHGKSVSKDGRVDYFFGNQADKDQPWNDGREFKWEDWEKHSADTWDHLAIMLSPTRNARCNIQHVTLRRGGKTLFDSRATASYPNKVPIKVGFKPTVLTVQKNRLPVLNLAEEMRQFRTQYYELGVNPILQMAYADLGQTEKRKYANRGNNWCSEFTSFIYRANEIETPDPNRSDVHFRNMREAFAKVGDVYSMREVAKWSNADKLKKIKPGSFVSIKLGESTHSLIFTTWIMPERGQPMTKYAAISGNNKGMVWSHDPISLPTIDELRDLSQSAQLEFDEKVYFGVPRDTPRR